MLCDSNSIIVIIQRQIDFSNQFLWRILFRRPDVWHAGVFVAFASCRSIAAVLLRPLLLLLLLGPTLVAVTCATTGRFAAARNAIGAVVVEIVRATIVR